MEKIRIRPSSIATFVSCPRQWYRVFVLKEYSIPSARAIIGTGIHSGVEAMWKEAISSKDKSNPNVSMMTDAAVESYDNEVKNSEHGITYEEGMDDNIARHIVRKGTRAFIDDIVPFTKIPEFVEKRYTIPIEHPMVEDISGTVDYISDDTIADVKTSKRKIIVQGHVIQQSIYKHLAESNGRKVNNSIIQGVILGKVKTVGGVEKLTPNVKQAKFLVNNLLEKLEVLWKGIVDPDILFPGNPKHYLCSDLYCSLRKDCPFVHGI